MTKRILTLSLVGLVLLSLLAMPVLAAPVAPDSILLDRDSEAVGAVTDDGTEYDIYRIENQFGYASGVEIYANGERVDSSSEAHAVIRAYAETEAAADLGTDDVERLWATQANLTTVPAIAEELRATTATTGAYLEALADESVDDDRTAYDVAANASLALATFNETHLLTLDEEITDWTTAAEELQAETTALTELLDAREAGEDVDAIEVFEQYTVTMAAYDDFDRASGQLEERLDGMTDASQTITLEVFGVPDYGEPLAMEFARLGHDLGPLTERVVGISTQVDDNANAVSDRERMANSLERTLSDEWENRLDSAGQVYSTIVILFTLVVGTGGYLAWRRQ